MLSRSKPLLPTIEVSERAKVLSLDTAKATWVRKSRGRPVRRRFFAFLFVAPTLLGLGLFVFFPAARVFYLSLTDYSGLGRPEWRGLDNYTYLANDGQAFWRVLQNTALLLLAVPLWIGVPFLVSLMLFDRPSGKYIRAVLFIPVMLPPVIAGGAFRMLLAEGGLLNESLSSVGLDVLALPWLSSERLVLLTVALIIGWAVLGIAVMFFTSALTSMSATYVEAAIVDGASWWQIVRYIYWPAVRTTRQFLSVLFTIAVVTSLFGWIYALTQGGPGVSSRTLDFSVYEAGIQTGRLGVGSALAVVGILLVVIVLTLRRVIDRGNAADWGR